MTIQSHQETLQLSTTGGGQDEVDEVDQPLEKYGKIHLEPTETRKLVYIKRRFKVSRLGIFEASIILFGWGEGVGQKWPFPPKVFSKSIEEKQETIG